MSLTSTLGDFTLGGFESSIGGSIDSPLPGILADPTAHREFLLRATPVSAFGSFITIDGLGAVAYAASPAIGNFDTFTIEVRFMCVGPIAGGAGQTVFDWCKGATIFTDDHRVAIVGDGLSINSQSYHMTNVGPSVITATAAQCGLATFFDGKWHTVSCVVQPISGGHQLYVDGILVGQGTPPLFTFDAANRLLVGVDGSLATTNLFNGSIDAVRIWSTARSQTEIRGYIDRSLVGNEPGLMHLWKFNDGSGTVISNAVPAQATKVLTLTGPVTWGGGTVAVDLSSGGYVSQPTDVPYKIFPSALASAYGYKASLPTPDLAGGGSVAVREIKVNNIDKSRSADALNDWLGASADVYVGLFNDPLSGFTRILHGLSAAIKADSTSWSLMMRDQRFRLQRPLLRNRYGGFGAAVRCDGVDDTLTATFAPPAGSMTMEYWYRPLTLPTNLAPNGWKPGVAGDRAVLNHNTIAGKLFFQCRNDANAQIITPTDAALVVGQRYHIAFVLDASVGQLRGYINGLPAFTPSAPIGGTWNTVVTAFQLCGNPGLGYTSGEIDEIRIFNYARSQLQIQSTMNKELTSVEPGLVYYNQLDNGTGATNNPVIPAGPAQALTLNGGALWVGSLEGDAALAGTPKPILLGFRRQIPAKCVDPQRLVYQIHDGPVASISAVRDKGDPRTFNVNRTDIYAGTPPAGGYDTCLAQGLIRLNAPPYSGEITVDAQGDNTGASGYRQDVPGIIKKLVQQFGGLADVDVDQSSLNALYTLMSSIVVGYFWDNEIDIANAVDEVTGASRTWWLINRTGQVTVGRIGDPATTPTVASIGVTDLVDPSKGGTFQRDPLGIRVGRVRLGYRPYSKVLSLDQTATGLPLATRIDYANDYRFVESLDPQRSIDFDTITVVTAFDDSVAAQTECDRLLSMWRVDRFLWTVTLSQGLLSYFIGMGFLATFGDYDAVAPTPMIIVGLDETMGDTGQFDKLSVVLFK